VHGFIEEKQTHERSGAEQTSVVSQHIVVVVVVVVGEPELCTSICGAVPDSVAMASWRVLQHATLGCLLTEIN
jgi:hypothetical protein